MKYSIYGSINKIFPEGGEGGSGTPFIVNYGLILILIALVFALFAGVSVQLRYIKKSLVHLQSQVVALNRNKKGRTKETSVRREEL